MLHPYKVHPPPYSILHMTCFLAFSPNNLPITYQRKVICTYLWLLSWLQAWSYKEKPFPACWTATSTFPQKHWTSSKCLHHHIFQRKEPIRGHWTHLSLNLTYWMRASLCSHFVILRTELCECFTEKIPSPVGVSHIFETHLIPLSCIKPLWGDRK